MARETELFEEEEGVKVLERATKQVEIVFSNVFNDKIDDLELECLNKTLESLQFFGKIGSFGRSCCYWLNPRAIPTYRVPHSALFFDILEDQEQENLLRGGFNQRSGSGSCSVQSVNLRLPWSPGV